MKIKPNLSTKKANMSFLLFAILLISFSSYIKSSSSTVTESSPHTIYKELRKTRNNKSKGLLVLFYSPRCEHCRTFEKTYIKAANELVSNSNNGLMFLQANCEKNPSLIPAFQVIYFPFLVYFSNGLPKAKMPLILADSKVLAE
jgi:thioredoxin-like negative regulator of GroEL